MGSVPVSTGSHPWLIPCHPLAEIVFDGYPYVLHGILRGAVPAQRSVQQSDMPEHVFLCLQREFGGENGLSKLW